MGDFLNVLISQRQLYDTQDQLVQSEALVTQNLIALYKALGGGWSESDKQTQPEQNPPQPQSQPEPQPEAAPSKG